MTTDHHDLAPLDISYSNPMTRAAWDILEQAQEESRALSIARACAAYEHYLEPETPEEYLYWLKDQAKVQEAAGDEEEDLQTALNTYRFAKTLWSYVYELAKLGIHTVDPTPKEKEGERHTDARQTDALP